MSSPPKAGFRTPRGGAPGRYTLGEELASGGMATVYLAKLNGHAGSGFTRVVAAKRLHAHYARDPEFSVMLFDEARLVSRIRHPNVVPTLDVVDEGSELYIVMEYVPGESLSRLAKLDPSPPVEIAVGVVADMLAGLHAAHEATDADGSPLSIVHRDVSPQNVLVGADGLARLIDFGVAKAAWRLQTTRDGQLKGKFSYMAPEQLLGDEVDRRADLYAAGVVLWELLTGRRLHAIRGPEDIAARMAASSIEPPARYRPGLPRELERVVCKALSHDPRDRFDDARAMAAALESAARRAAARDVGAWVVSVAEGSLRAREAMVARLEHDASAGGARGRAEGDATGTLSTFISGPHTPPRTRAWRRLSALVATGALAIGATWATWRSMHNASSVGAGSSSATPSGAAAPPSALGSPPTRADDPEAASVRLSPELAPASEPGPAADAPARTSRGRPPAPRVGVASRGRAPRRDCSPPYTVDARGIHVPKPECLD